METAEFTQLISERNVSVVLERSGLSYEELLALLDVELVNANGVMLVDFAGADCNLTTATIEGLTTARLDIIHRFIRLQRKLGWPIYEVSNALAAFSATNIDDVSLLQLARVNDL